MRRFLMAALLCFGVAAVAPLTTSAAPLGPAVTFSGEAAPNVVEKTQYRYRRRYGRRGLRRRGFGRRGFYRRGFYRRGFGRRGFYRRGFGRRGFYRRGFGRRGFYRRGYGRRGFYRRRFF